MPSDPSNLLHPALQWFDDNPERYWWLACVAIASTAFLMLRPLLRPDWKDAKNTDWAWGLVIFCLLLAGRWPSLFVARELNVDESQLLSGAITLGHDPMYWRSVDGGSAGPLDYYVLLPAGWVHGANDYFSARITALLLIATALTFIHQAVALAYGKDLARITGFSALCFESLTQQPELLHYSTELVSISLLAAATFLVVRRLVSNGTWRWNAVGGLLLGAVPFAKPQAAPIAALLGLGWTVGELWCWRQDGARGRRRLIALWVGASTPALIAAGALTLTGLWRAAVVPYLLNHVFYATMFPCEFKEVFGLFLWRGLSDNGLLVYWLGGAIAWLLFSLPLARGAARFGRLVAAAAIALCGVGLGCVFFPGRPFVHYWQLLVGPVTLLVGAVTGLMVSALEEQSRHLRCGVLGAALLCTTGGLLYAKGSMPFFCVGQLVKYQAQPRGVAAQVVLQYARRGEALGVWGNITRCYVEAGLRQATRSAYSFWEIFDGPYRGYFRERYLADLRLNAPPVFVDAVGAGSDNLQGIRKPADVIFPELTAYLREKYTPVADVEGSRIYVRNDRLPAGSP